MQGRTHSDSQRSSKYLPVGQRWEVTVGQETGSWGFLGRFPYRLYKGTEGEGGLFTSLIDVFLMDTAHFVERGFS
jgi:hypothetical protein